MRKSRKRVSRKRTSRKRTSRRRSRRVSRKKILKYSAGGGLSSTLYLEDGSVYVGGLKNGVKHGQGTMTWPNGDKYVGEWKNNKFNGYGTMYWGDGRKYIGEWKNGQRNGKGTMTWDVIPACPGTGTVSGLRIVPENVAYIGEWVYDWTARDSLGLQKDGILISDSPKTGRRMWRRYRRAGPPGDCIKWPLEELTHILPTTGMKPENIKYILETVDRISKRQIANQLFYMTNLVEQKRAFKKPSLWTHDYTSKLDSYLGHILELPKDLQVRIISEYLK